MQLTLCSGEQSSDAPKAAQTVSRPFLSSGVHADASFGLQPEDQSKLRVEAEQNAEPSGEVSPTHLTLTPSLNNFFFL